MLLPLIFVYATFFTDVNGLSNDNERLSDIQSADHRLNVIRNIDRDSNASLSPKSVITANAAASSILKHDMRKDHQPGSRRGIISSRLTTTNPRDTPSSSKPVMRMDMGYLFDDSYFQEEAEEFKKGVRLSGSNLSYMGRVEVSQDKRSWGTICGDGWTVEDATVVCRQLGLDVGSVIAQNQMKFGSGFGPVVMSEVKCRGDEQSLNECRARWWNRKKSLPCSKYLRGAGVICGCPLDVTTNVKSRCFVYTGFPYDSLSCYHSCGKNRILVGDKRRECNFAQKWTGIRPTCARVEESRSSCRIANEKKSPCHRSPPLSAASVIPGSFPKSLSYDPEYCIASGCCYNISSYPRCYLPENSPCSSNPCENGGHCRDYIGSITKYECVCQETYGGNHCQYKRDWTCGKQKIKPNLYSVKPILRILGGRGAVVGSWPWVVQIRLNESYLCSGALIHRQWVLTAAHCMTLKNATNGPNTNPHWKVVVGRQNGADRSRGEDIPISFMFHNEFTNETVPKRDIALFKLSHPVKTDDYVDILCLPSFKAESPKAGSKCWVAGWGRISNLGIMAESLHQADLPIITNEECKSYQDYDNTYHLVSEDMLCAAYKDGGVDACDGDSGGPLMCMRPGGSWYVGGIVSWGYKCGDPRSPGVYTRVSYFLDWIHAVIFNN